jgi:hypothetical protein
MSYVIEDGIPPPLQFKQTRQSGPRTPLTRVIHDLQPGQSVLLADHCDYILVRGLWARMKPAKFMSKKEPDGWRIWRVE